LYKYFKYFLTIPGIFGSPHVYIVNNKEKAR